MDTNSAREAEDRRPDVPLAAAMLLWNDSHGNYYDGTSDEPADPLPPVVGDHSIQSVKNPEDYDNATGACFGYWRGYSDDERLVELLRDAWMAVVRDGVDPQQMHRALLAVPEFRATIHPGDLPLAYREDVAG